MLIILLFYLSMVTMLSKFSLISSLTTWNICTESCHTTQNIMRNFWYQNHHVYTN